MPRCQPRSTYDLTFCQYANLNTRRFTLFTRSTNISYSCCLPRIPTTHLDGVVGVHSMLCLLIRPPNFNFACIQSEFCRVHEVAFTGRRLSPNESFCFGTGISISTTPSVDLPPMAGFSIHCLVWRTGHGV